jgi:MFS family permease
MLRVPVFFPNVQERPQTAFEPKLSVLKLRVGTPDLRSMESERATRSRIRGRWALGLAVGLFVALRIAAAHQTAGNWDEFGLLEASSRTHETGVLHSGGRPGLAQLLVLPLVADCDDEIAVLWHARLLWVFITIAFIAGVGVLAMQLQPDRDRRRGDALLAVGLIAMVPEFLEWSIQVRTDQIALAGGVWGGVALLASYRRPAFALAAGLLFCVGFLSSQKLIYVAALMGLLALGQLGLARSLRPGREAIRVVLCATAFAVGFLVAHSLMAQKVELASNHSAMSSALIQSGMSSFDFYRNTIGWTQYRAMLPSLVPHIILLIALAAATYRALHRSRPLHPTVKFAWFILILGVSVGLFHAGAFFYFWMTLGVFPALAFAIARQPLCDLLPDPSRVQGVAIAAFWLILAAPGLIEMIVLLEDTQSVQRSSLDFVRHNFKREDAGFQPESALFCRGEGQPLPLYYSMSIWQEFGRENSEANQENLIQRFRNEEVHFLVQSFRLNQFPVSIRRFWAENYQPYLASVFVAGRQLEGGAGTRSAFELITPGPYRWLPRSGPQPVEVDGKPIRPGEIVHLQPGEHTASFSEDGTGGMLVLALSEPPGAAPLEFYKRY